MFTHKKATPNHALGSDTDELLLRKSRGKSFGGCEDCDCLKFHPVAFTYQRNSKDGCFTYGTAFILLLPTWGPIWTFWGGPYQRASCLSHVSSPPPSLFHCHPNPNGAAGLWMHGNHRLLWCTSQAAVRLGLLCWHSGCKATGYIQTPPGLKQPSLFQSVLIPPLQESGSTESSGSTSAQLSHCFFKAKKSKNFKEF